METSLSDMKIIFLRRQKESSKCLNDVVLNNGLIAQCGKAKKYGFKFCYDCNMKELPKQCESEGCTKRICEKWQFCYDHKLNRPRTLTVYDA